MFVFLLVTVSVLVSMLMAMLVSVLVLIVVRKGMLVAPAIVNVQGGPVKAQSRWTHQIMW